MSGRVRVTWETNNGRERGEYVLALPANWVDMSEQQRENWLSDVENETYFEVFSVRAVPIEEAATQVGGGE